MADGADSFERLICANEVAKILGVKIERVFALAREGIVPCVRLGRQLRFSPNALRQFIESGGKALPGGWRRDGEIDGDI